MRVHLVEGAAGVELRFWRFFVGCLAASAAAKVADEPLGLRLRRREPPLRCAPRESAAAVASEMERAAALTVVAFAAVVAVVVAV